MDGFNACALCERSYLDALADDIGDQLLENGVVTIADLAKTYDLPGDSISQVLLVVFTLIDFFDISFGLLKMTIYPINPQEIVGLLLLSALKLSECWGCVTERLRYRVCWPRHCKTAWSVRLCFWFAGQPDHHELMNINGNDQRHLKLVGTSP